MGGRKQKHDLGVAAAAALSVVMLGMAMPDPARAAGGSESAQAELAALKAQLELMQRKIEELERKQAEAAAQTRAAQAKAAQLEATQLEAAKVQRPAADAVTAGETKGSFKLPGLNTSVTLGGYIKGDVIYSSISAGPNSASNQNLFNPDIPVGAARENDRDVVSLHARQTRLFFKTATPTGYGSLGTYVEGDFFGSGGTQTISNSYGFRIRHAYGTLGPFLAGQTWSTFMNAGALPETIDFGGPVGQIFIRQGQVRWTQPFSGGNWQFALENPETTLARLDGGTLVTFNPDDDRVPDIVGRINLESDLGSYSLALMARELRIDNAIARDSTWGGGLSVAGIVPTVDNDTFTFTLNYGNALGRYQYSVFPGAALDANGRIDKIDEWGGFLSYRHFWLPELRSTLAYSYARADNPVSEVGGTANKAYHSVHANLLWSPVDAVNLGLEYIYGYRRLEDDESGNLNRVQFGAQYLF